MPITLTPTSEKLVSDFDDAAKAWGWSSDQGSETTAARDEAVYILADAALRARIAMLERTVRKQRAEIRSLTKPVKSVCPPDDFDASLGL